MSDFFTFDLSKIKEYLPLIAVPLAAVLTYLFGFRKGKKDKFNTQIEESLEEILSPMLHSLRFIMREKNAFQREKLIKGFFFKFSSQETRLHKLPNKYILDWYYKTEDLFYDFTDNRKREDWEEFWVYFLKYNTMIDGEYRSVRSIIYSDYKWLIDLSQKNMFIRLIIEFFVFIYELCKFVLISCFLFIIGFIIEYIQGKQLTPEYFKQITTCVFIASLLVCGVLLICLSEYSAAKQMQRESNIGKIIQKLSPKIYSIWNSVINIGINLEKEKKRISIPDMYDR